MNPSVNKNTALGRLLAGATVLVAVLLAYNIFSAIHTLHTTGLLNITASDAKATISISQANSEAKIVGKGTARLRLKPGNYLLIAGNAGRKASALVRVSLQRTATTTLKLVPPAVIPSADNIDFTGLDELISNGLTTTQITNLRQLFFEYKRSAKAITIDTSSVQPGPRDPNGTDPTFSLNFTGTIDGAPYKATASYADLTNIQLVLLDPQTDTQLYSGRTASPSPDR